MSRNTTSQLRILLADDHAVVREGLASMIERQPDMTVVAEATNGEEAVELHAQLAPDVTLMDLRMPGIGGIEAINCIVRNQPSARILVLTSFTGDEDIYRAVEAGAVGYVTKTMTRDEILKGVRTAASGLRYFPPGVAARLVEYGPRSDLTRKESAVLELIAQGRSNREIGCELGITEGTVKGHVSSILTKLDAPDRTGAVTLAMKRGILHLV